MAQMVEFEVTGFEITIQKSNVEKDKIKEEVKKALKDFMERVLMKAKELSPVKTGALRDSVNIGPVSDFEWFLQDGVPYGKHQEFGFTSSAGRFVQNPFAEPAFRSTRPTIVRL